MNESGADGAQLLITTPAQQALIDKVRRRRGIRQQQAEQPKPRSMAQDGEIVRQKHGEFLDLTRMFAKFSSGTAYLPEPLKSEVNLFEGNFCPGARALQSAFDKQLRNL